ncbi:hypothetical protein LEP1GSC103_0944 [Leptospira borgpetersenii serovar Javanica str. UI 09931]|uniref:Uncharacterized protein n=4 Tax=Leptospira borgpetersenii TaxID=174 RepID=M3H3H9_LEPBO|nr:hypothetical protein LEP1GSC128_4108 [Leptospira borgpetersenii str. 200801926]EKQ91159.1 hypothetical protein LEP1GSC101_1375 [Leptospira borgpetersenii str. UI 09149]EKR02192.1 hypothetical protein LEP1GSC121_0766 [Leptospira borgpetersenii serovar Castellonis str. 200801910]EMG01644.1 hypothetical protein LEP1GSC123_4004 [Leptospira borgpetersenii str. 200701203]EMK10997.1 hypothetical protein LEP1GSC066_2641 [Leptospira sp. serovar Kenya str. Sh9]EMN12319.1 hypothetical protein LEP1GSC0
MTAYYLKLGKISIIICFVVFGFTNCAMGSVTITGKIIRRSPKRNLLM